MSFSKEDNEVDLKAFCPVRLPVFAGFGGRVFLTRCFVFSLA